MQPKPEQVFVMDCHVCRRKVPVLEKGHATCGGGVNPHTGDLDYGVRVSVGKCQRCYTILVGESQQVAIGQVDAEDDEWGDFVRVYPDPPRVLRSSRIPKTVLESIADGEKSLQANANVAACVMFGRALEALCRDMLQEQKTTAQATTRARPVMLGEGIRKLKDKGLIDKRLYDWSQELHAFRNIAAHPTNISITREEAEDLRIFVFAIMEYVYDLTDRYNEFKKRQAKKKAKPT